MNFLDASVIKLPELIHLSEFLPRVAHSKAVGHPGSVVRLI